VAFVAFYGTDERSAFTSFIRPDLKKAEGFHSLGRHFFLLYRPAGLPDIMTWAAEISSAVSSGFRVRFASPGLPRGRVSGCHFVA
jgi:hypothetical protein